MMYGFERLIRWMDAIAEKTDEEVIMQIGNTEYEPKHTSYFRFESKEKMDQFYSEARVIVCHAGVGSLMTSLENEKLVIAVPRNKELGEVIDDHQLEISKELEKEGRIMVANTLNELENHLQELKCTASPLRIKNELVESLKRYISQYNKSAA
jgi:beta-1,4-N-acetylglucosaminyltransferase